MLLGLLADRRRIAEAENEFADTSDNSLEVAVTLLLLATAVCAGYVLELDFYRVAIDVHADRLREAKHLTIPEPVFSVDAGFVHWVDEQDEPQLETLRHLEQCLVRAKRAFRGVRTREMFEAHFEHPMWLQLMLRSDHRKAW